jgi:NAD(P)-dependent dehydrogenase (short-subunit alcohol dehydrogenase family)
VSESVFRDGLLDGKVALVTGGGSGIGAGIARRLAGQGAALALLGRKAEKLETVRGEIEAAGGRAIVVPADVRDYDAVAGAVEKAVTAFGGLDILVCSAAGNFLAPAAALSANGFRSVIDIDLCGTFNACRAAFSALAARRGCVVSISANQATVPTPLQVHAGAAKAGIEKLTRDLALEWASSGVRLNTVVPGPIAGTEGMRRLAPPGSDEHKDRHVPLGRWGEIDEIAEVVLFLCSRAAAYMTGTSVVVDGGSALTGAARFLELLRGQT